MNKKSPFRRDPPSRMGGNLPPINQEFKDISSPQEMLKFIKEHRKVLDSQDAEIDNRTNETEDIEPIPNIFNQAPQPIRQRTTKTNIVQEEVVEEELEEQYRRQEAYEPEQEESFQAAPPPKPPITNSPLNKLKNIDLSKLDAATRKRLEDSMVDKPNQKVITNTPSGEGAAVAAPRISESQLRRKIEKEYKEELERNPQAKPLDEPKTQIRFSINNPTNAIEYDWERFEPVSGCIFYAQSEIFVRRFNLVDTMRISKAMENNDISGFIDALGNCIQTPFNIRDLSYPDFKHLMYWHWFNSYTKVPHDLTWTSKYGNKNIYKVSETNLKLVTPTIDKIEYMKWKYKGYAVPTVRDAEVFIKETLSPDEEYILNHAQYFDSDPRDPSISSKIDTMNRLCAKSTIPIQELSEFKKAIYHEVVESVDVIDAKFEPVLWIKLLEGQMQIIEKEISDYEDEGDTLSALSSEDERSSLEDEVNRLKEGLANNKGGAELAEVETIRLDRPILKFFPFI